METLSARANTLFFFATTALLALAVGSAITTWWLPATATVSLLRINDLSSLRPQREAGSLVDRAMMTLDIHADLTGVFNWNVKQLFVYVTAEYESGSHPRNSVVVWDRVVQNASSAILRLNNAPSKYPLIDHGTGLRGATVALKVNYDVMPITGSLYTSSIGSYRARLPPEYCGWDASKACTLAVLSSGNGGGSIGAAGSSSAAGSGAKSTS